jgi:hypothetical protein
VRVVPDAEYLDATDRYLRLALKAQGQCRATLETLAAIKTRRPYSRDRPTSRPVRTK